MVLLGRNKDFHAVKSLLIDDNYILIKFDNKHKVHKLKDLDILYLYYVCYSTYDRCGENSTKQINKFIEINSHWNFKGEIRKYG